MTRLDAAAIAGALLLAIIFMQPLLRRGRERADRDECRRNLAAIVTEAHNYGATFGGVLPLAPLPHPAAYRSLQKLADHSPALTPRHFICPGSQRSVAPVRETSNDTLPRYVLSAEHSTYAWLGEYPQFPHNSAWIADDQVATTLDPDSGGENHIGGLNVGYGNRSVQWVRVDELPQDALLPLGLVDNSGERPKR